jgi:hypothetical protein
MAKRTHKDIVKEKLVATGLDLEKDIRVIQEVLEDLDPKVLQKKEKQLKYEQTLKKVMDKYGDSLRPFTEKITIDVSVDLSPYEDSLIGDCRKLYNDANEALFSSKKVKEKLKLCKKAVSEIDQLKLNPEVIWNLLGCK